MNKKEIKTWNKYFKYSNLKPSKEELDNFLNNATEEDKLRNELGSLEKGINSAMLDTCEIYGLSGNCGKNCPKFQDKSCECYDELLEED